MVTNDPFTRFDLDCIRLTAIQSWASLLQRTYHIDVDIVDLACGEACRRYKELENRLKFLIPPSLEEVRELIETWVTWKALDLQVSRQDCIIGLDGTHAFTQDLEQMLNRLTAHADEARFIL